MYKKIGDFCPHCYKDNLEYKKENHPWNDEHLECPFCGSTYLINKEDKTISRELVSIDLGVNFNGYPLEMEDGEEIIKFLEENQLLRLHKNKQYRLVLKVEEIERKDPHGYIAKE